MLSPRTGGDNVSEERVGSGVCEQTSYGALWLNRNSAFFSPL